MTKRAGAGFTYVLVVISTLLLRICSSLGVGSGLEVSSDWYFTLIVQLLCFGVLPVTVYYLFCLKGKPGAFLTLTRDFRFVKLGLRDFGRTVIIGVCMIYIAVNISYAWQILLNGLGYTRTPATTDVSTIALLFAELFMTALLPGVFEELTHRGLLFAGYRESGYKVVVISALMFSLMHQNITQTGYTFFDGIVLALLVYYTGSILPAIFVHFFNNAVSVFTDFGVQYGGFFSFMDRASDWLYGTIPGLAVNIALFAGSAALMLFMFKRMRADAVARGVVPSAPFYKNPGAPALRKDVFLWAAIAIGVTATAMSLVWGVTR